MKTIGPSYRLILVKLGGSVITDKKQPYTIKMNHLQRLTSEIHSAKQRCPLKMIIGHGGGSFPHTPAAQFQVHKGQDESTPRGVALVQAAAAQLNRLVVTAFIEAGENAISVQPSASVLSENFRISQWDTSPLESMLSADLLPVIYGDVVMDSVQGWRIVSTEDLFFYLALKLPVQRIVIGTDVDGVLGLDSGRSTIDIITPSDLPRISSSLQGAGAIDVTGGMKTKVESLVRLAEEKKIESVIFNAGQPGALESILCGQRTIGTLIRPDPKYR